MIDVRVNAIVRVPPTEKIAEVHAMDLNAVQIRGGVLICPARDNGRDGNSALGKFAPDGARGASKASVLTPGEDFYRD